MISHRFSSEETVWDLNDNAIVAASPANRQHAIAYVETLGTRLTLQLAVIPGWAYCHVVGK